MGLILDTGILIARERKGGAVEDILSDVLAICGEVDVAISAVTVIELTHGIHRARNESERERRRIFCENVFRNLIVHPLDVEIGRLAGKIEGEQAAVGINIAFEDLVIGATALHLGYDVATFNAKHFSLIPNLKLVAL